MPPVDLLFPVIGSRLPTDHAYPLYSALSHLLPEVHAGNTLLGLAPVSGEYAGDGQLALSPQRSRLRLRVSADSIPSLLPLAGKQVRVLGQRIQFGVPQVEALRPSETVYSHAVTIKHALDESAFLEAARRQLDALGIGGEAELARIRRGERRGEVRRSVIRIKGDAVVCFGLLVSGLGADESLKLQTHGIGGRRSMGAGFFLPAEGEDDR